MSFNYNPYEHIEIVRNQKNGRWRWYCDSCGGDANTDWESESQLELILDDYKSHVLNSHNRTPDDFDGWSVY